MKRNFIASLLAFAIILSCVMFTSCGKSSDESPWRTSWASATSEADELDKNILVFFSNIESDETSQKLNESFNKKSFQKKVAANYVLLNYDFGNQDEKDYLTLQEGYEMANKFTVQSLPAIILATPEGYVLGSVINEDILLPASKVISKIVSFNKKSKEVTKARKELAEAQELDRLYAIDNLISSLDGAYRYLMTDLLSEIKQADPENETGLVTKYALSFAYVEAIGEYGQGNAQGAIDIFLKVAENETVPADDAQEAYMTACYLLANAQLGTPEQILELMNKAIEVSPKSKQVESIKQSVEYMQQFLTSSEAENAESSDNAAQASVENKNAE
ncbi:MAG: thioredoxin family protein [Treponemataceae bacterium]|nr:thioredoxin family protein [Spirochaetales bacterium]MDY6032182.1 thioredoxin family protein [Treponemataceae bacterium]